MRSRRTLLLIGVLIVVAPACLAQTPEARVKECIAQFLGLPIEDIKWPKFSVPTEAPNFDNPLSFTFADPPTSAPSADGPRIELDINVRDWYVQIAAWSASSPRDDEKSELASIEASQAVAEAYVRSKLKPWPKGMKLTRSGQVMRGRPSLGYWFNWDEFVGQARTGTFFSVMVNPAPPIRVYHSFMYIAPAVSPDVVKISREQALKIAAAEAAKQGFKNPRFIKVDLYLSEQHLEQPHWHIGFDYDNRNGGFLEDLFIDAVTGKLLTPVYN